MLNGDEADSFAANLIDFIFCVLKKYEQFINHIANRLVNTTGSSVLMALKKLQSCELRHLVMQVAEASNSSGYKP